MKMGRIALISTAFYFTPLLVDVFCARFVDKIGYRKSVVACVIMYAIGSGLIEVLCSPIVEACPL